MEKIEKTKKKRKPRRGATTKLLNKKEKACDKEADEATEIREKIMYGLVSLENALKESMDALSVVSSGHRPVVRQSEEILANLMEWQGRSKSIDSINSGMSALSLAGRRVNLPKLEMKKVSGRISEWQEFWDGFKSAIYDDVQLANVNKSEYLKSYLEEPVRSVVTGFPLTKKNYVTTIELFKKGYA